MKTFLRTTLFRFVVFIAVSVVLGFGNLVPRGFVLDDYSLFEKLLPNHMKASLELQGWDKCKQEQKAQALSEVSSSESPDAATVIESERSVVNDLKTDIAGMKQELSQQLTDQLNELYTLMAQQAQQLASACQTNGEEIVSTPVDLNAQRAAEIQAQIQQLQAEMENLY